MVKLDKYLTGCSPQFRYAVYGAQHLAIHCGAAKQKILGDNWHTVQYFIS